ncbi:endonuclease/exonuclease/phosphatase family protein [Tenacibaculum sp. 190524A02b]|uniref:endonuclease/exonuclease/phosphatase family protein n=1 Tax=Tenacibaculum vairaonense TaxID=3137860 RepID=UPI0032B121B8
MKTLIFKLSMVLLALTITSCSNEDLSLMEQKEHSKQHKKGKNVLRFVTYNIHGGKGPNNEGDLKSNLEAFKKLLSSEEVLFLQEVQPHQVETVKDIYDDFPHSFYTKIEADSYWDWGTFSFKKRESGQIILSKIPFQIKHEKLIQKDPGGDHWERKAQEVTLEMSNKRKLKFFHYHNTYNWNLDDFASEKEGMIKYRNYVDERINETSYNLSNNLIMLGDFNLFKEDVTEIINTKAHAFNGRDHINSMIPFLKSGSYNTFSKKLSDHDAVWAEIDY